MQDDTPRQPVVLIDFESRSRADLKKCGGRKYWEHPSSEAICVVWYDTRDDSVGAWVPGQPWPHAGRVLAAHNASGFDRFAAERYGFQAAGWVDTSQLARKAGLPGALDALGTRWLGVPKDDEGSKFTRTLSRVRRPTKASGREITAAAWKLLSPESKREQGLQPELTDEVRARVLAYCASDVAILAQAWPKLQEWLLTDARVEALDRVINDRGVYFDRELARRLIREDERQGREAVQAAAAELGVPETSVIAGARSPQQFCAFAGTSNARATTVDKLLDGSEESAAHGRIHPCALPLARVRRALASVSTGKLRAGLVRVHADGRLRDTLRYYGAHTGRWSGQGMQLQNLPRPARQFSDLPADTQIPHTIDKDGKRVVDIDAFADAVLGGMHVDADAVSLLVRATLCAPPGYGLAVCDFASVEARATAWAAGDEDELEVYRQGLDPYKTAAAAVYDVAYDEVDKSQRAVGKVCVLALGYGGGPGAFAKMAAGYGVDLSALNTRQVVDAWREAHRPVVSLWYACERAFRSALEGRSRWAGQYLEFIRSREPDANGEYSVACFLPSGRPVVYPGAKADDNGLTYRSARGIAHIYGGKIVENAIQALCRDLMAEALLRADRAGLRVVLHVHDELVCEAPLAELPQTYAKLHEVMTTLPAWAACFPVGADGYIAKRYRK